MTYVIGSLLIVAGTAASAWLVRKSDQLAAEARQPHPDHTDYQARFEADQQRRKA